MIYGQWILYKVLICGMNWINRIPFWDTQLQSFSQSIWTWIRFETCLQASKLKNQAVRIYHGRMEVLYGNVSSSVLMMPNIFIIIYIVSGHYFNFLFKCHFPIRYSIFNKMVTSINSIRSLASADEKNIIQI